MRGRQWKVGQGWIILSLSLDQPREVNWSKVIYLLIWDMHVRDSGSKYACFDVLGTPSKIQQNSYVLRTQTTLSSLTLSLSWWWEGRSSDWVCIMLVHKNNSFQYSAKSMKGGSLINYSKPGLITMWKWSQSSHMLETGTWLNGLG